MSGLEKIVVLGINVLRWVGNILISLEVSEVEKIEVFKVLIVWCFLYIYLIDIF